MKRYYKLVFRLCKVIKVSSSQPEIEKHMNSHMKKFPLATVNDYQVDEINQQTYQYLKNQIKYKNDEK